MSLADTLSSPNGHSLFPQNGVLHFAFVSEMYPLISVGLYRFAWRMELRLNMTLDAVTFMKKLQVISASKCRRPGHRKLMNSLKLVSDTTNSNDIIP